MDFHPSKASYSSGNPQLWHLIKVRGSSPGLRPMYSPSQTTAIHSYPGPFSFLAICTALILDFSSFHNIVLLPYIRTSTSNISVKTNILKLQIPNIYQGPDCTCNPPPARHLPIALCPICTLFIQNTLQIFKFQDML